jgi:hypothetical protein
MRAELRVVHIVGVNDLTVPLPDAKIIYRWMFRHRRSYHGAPFGAELFKLRVKSLAVGADAGVSEAAVLWVNFGHMFCKSQLLDNIGSMKFCKFLDLRTESMIN